MMRRTLIMLLSLAMITSLLSGLSFAEKPMSTQIDYVFADIEEPQVGAAPSYDANYGGNGYFLSAGNNNPNYYENGVGWYDITADKNVPVLGKFEADHIYKVMIFFEAKENYEFVPSFSAQINGTDAEVTFLSETAVMAELRFYRLPAERVNPFTDVHESDFFYDPVLWAVEDGVTTGTSATTFSPNANCTRGQVVTFLWRTAGCPEPHSYENPFKDVSADAYYYKAVLWAVGSNITAGTSFDTFSPDASCTRAQVVTFLWRANGRPEPKSTNPFADVSNNEYYYEAVLWAVERGITSGVSATSFAPDASCTRGQIVTFLYRFIGY